MLTNVVNKSYFKVLQLFPTFRLPYAAPHKCITNLCLHIIFLNTESSCSCVWSYWPPHNINIKK